MPHLESFSTAGMDPRRKLTFWNDIACSSFTPIVSDPIDLRSFAGSLTRGRIGELSVAEVFSEAQWVRHSRLHVARTRSPMFFLHLQLDGRSLNRQDGREAVLNAGDFTLCDSTRPYEMQFTGPNHMFVLGIPDASLRRHLASPECLVAIPMSGSSGLSGLLSDFLRHFWREYQCGLDDAAANRVSGTILDLVSSAYSVAPQARADRSSLAAAHLVRILNYIEAHLTDPELTPTQIAGACRMTTRYLHHLFSEENETVSRYILRRRLEACARALSCPAQRGRTVTSIAFDYGFNSPTHFGRVFRSRFGVTPREFRRAPRHET
jgi:AraC family transcriptional regulator, positive regulator of tynA and feaB